MTIHWPDIRFPPVNLYSLPRTAYPHMYIELETAYCRDATHYNIKDKREEFNRLWNARFKG